MVVNNSSDLNQLLSKSCYQSYPITPVIKNEIINRSKLSTPGVQAQKKLVSALLTNEIKSNLGFEGNGPEVSVTQSIIFKNKLISNGGRKHLQLNPPGIDSDPNLLKIWEHIQRFLNESDSKTRDLHLLIDELKQPPYGMKQGLINLLLWIVLIYNQKSLSIYENNTYLPKWGSEIFERFTKAPEHFTVRWLGYNQQLDELLKVLNDSIPVDEKDAAPDNLTVANFIYKLFHWYMSLPEFTKLTTSLSQTCLNFREALNSGVDPIELLSKSLPDALGLDNKTQNSKQNKQFIDEYNDKFNDAIIELSNSYENLIIDISKGDTKLLILIII